MSLTLAAVGCGGGGSGGNPPGGGAPTMKVVGMSGGAVSSSDGKLAVSIPAGALGSDVTITTEPATAPASGAVGTVYEIGPSGTQFAMPVTLTLHYDGAALGGAAEASLRVATFAGGAWQLLPGAVVDKQAKTVSGVTTHLSPYAIVTEAAGKTCATVQAAFGCADPGAPGGGTTATGGTSGAGTSAAACEAPTCAGATNVCAQYPGSAMDSCVDGAKGYTASCCFAPSAPICFATAAGFGCADPGTSAGGGGGGSICPPPPTCATATDACGNYPGATLQNCANNSTGYAGACCFQPDAPVCVAVTTERACAGSPAGGAGGCSTPPPRCADGNPCARFAGATTSGCTDTTYGFKATCCFAVGTLPVVIGGSGSSGGTDKPDGGAPTTDAGSGGGQDAGATGGTGASTGGGGTGGSTGGVCAPGAACSTPGLRCGDASPTSCTECTCGADGHYTCMPCGGGTGGTTGGGTGGTTGGGPVCAPGAMCEPGFKCGSGASGSCMECTCDGTGHLMCMPCGGGTGGAPGGTGGAGGTAMGPCQVMPMPAPDVGLPCGVMETCPDGSSYRVRCDGTSGACTCFANGAPQTAMPTMSCAGFDPMAALVACGFPPGKI